MKQTFTLAFALLLTFMVHAQIPKLKEVQNVQQSEVIIGLTGDLELDKNLEEMVKKFWTICPISEILPLKEARKKAKENDKLYVIHFGSLHSMSPKRYIGDNYYFKDISTGYFIGLTTGAKKPLMRSYIPIFDNEFTEEVLSHGVTYMQELFTLMLDNEVGALKTLKIIKDNSTQLKDKVLYIPEWWMDSKLTEEDITKRYKGKYEIVSHYEWSSAILNKTPGIAYSIIIPVPMGGKYVYQHHICDAETSQIYGITQPKGAAIQLNGLNMSKANKGYVSKKNLDQYNDVLNGK
ncbi:hypothetical protein [Maribacter sp. LLG6340-A2]|uniref:hypothetical protein n=1 Tax=Maribacter sp. LLG6340-A2 TaxID=3160834 RepID=UPI00386B74E9